MNKEQLREYYRRFCRWQEEGPRYVNRHPDTVQHCHNCGTEFTDNFCPRCGQRAGVGRVGWNAIRENIALLWGMDSRSLSYTLFQLVTRPGYLVRDYISGHRQVSFPPVKMLVIVGLFAVIFQTVFHIEGEKVLPIKFGIPAIDNAVKWFNDNKSWGELFYSSFCILPTWAMFRFGPRYPRHTLPEGFFLQVFLSVQGILWEFLNCFCGGISSYIEFIYTIITYRQLFGYSWWGTIWRYVVTVIVTLLMFVTFMIPFLVLSKDINVEADDIPKAILMGSVIIAVMLLLSALILFIPYCISLRKYKKTQRKNAESAA